MRVVPIVLLCACASAAPAPAAQPSPEGSGTEWLRPRPEPGSIAALDEEVRRLAALAERSERPGPLVLRLADALQERAAAHGRAEMVAVEASFANPATRDESEARAEAHREARAADLTRARRLLEAIGSEGPEAEGARKALFWLLGERREWQADALAAARSVVARERRGPLLGAAHLRLAEAAFVDARLPEALTHYDALLATEGADAETRAFASYKRGWALLNLERLEEADQAFARALALTGARDALAREVARDRVRLQVMLERLPETVLAVIEESTDDAAFRATLAHHYERMLLDAGRVAEAEAFRERLLR